VRGLDTTVRWAITGTPLVNHMSDLVSLMGFLGVPHSEKWTWEARYNEILPKILIHRSMEELRGVLSDAPPEPRVFDEILPFESEEEEDFYFGIQGANAKKIQRFDMLPPQDKLILLLRLRQISVHPQVYIEAMKKSGKADKDWVGSSTKLSAIRRIIEDTEVHKYLIFCSFHMEMELIHEELELDVEVLMYHGGMSQRERKETLEKSKRATGTTVMLIQIQAGGVGLNLQEYDRVIFVSPYWTSALMDQALARAVRMGQKEVVKVYHLRLEAEHESWLNIDKMVSDKADEKRIQLEKVFAMCKV